MVRAITTVINGSDGFTQLVLDETGQVAQWIQCFFKRFIPVINSANLLNPWV